MGDNQDTDGGGARDRPKWEVYSDENGNMYFYNTMTGETSWELPPEEPSDDEESSMDKECLAQSIVMTATGDAVVSNYMHDSEGNLVELTVVQPRPNYSPYQIAVEVVEVMLWLVDNVESRDQDEKLRLKKKKKFVSAAAQARAMKNEANQAKKRKRERILAMTRYMNILIPPVATPSITHNITEGKRPVGALFSTEDAKRWRIEREVHQIRQRYARRKLKDKHHVQVRARAEHGQFLKQFRIELLKHFISQIPCSSELQQQRVVLMTTPQLLAELELKRRESLEPALLERYDADKKNAERERIKNIRKVFVLADHGGEGSIHLLQALFTSFSDEQAQKYAMKVSGLAELLNKVEIQRFVVDFVSLHHPNGARVTIDDFHDFVKTIEEVFFHFKSVQAAVKEAEDEIAAAMEAAASVGSSAGSLLRARLNMMSKKKVALEAAQLKATQLKLERQKKQEKLAALQQNDADGPLMELLAAKEDWEKNHHHRYVQIESWLPVYCCLCRRRKWEQWRRDCEEEESNYRATYSNRYALKMKTEELRLMGEDESTIMESKTAPVEETRLSDLATTPPTLSHPVEAIPTQHLNFDGDDEERIVHQVVSLLVIMTERIHSEEAMKTVPQARIQTSPRRGVKQHQKGSPRKKKTKRPKATSATIGEGKHGDKEMDDLQVAMKQFEAEERERKLLNAEESAMHVYVERSRRGIERPLLLSQDTAHNAYIKLLSHCVNPCSLLYRMQFERSLVFEPPQRLVALMIDPAVAFEREFGQPLILRIVPCRSEQEAAFTVHQMTQVRSELNSNFVTTILDVSKHIYQFFADSGVLIECWPVVFVTTTYYPSGSWRDAFTKAVAGSVVATDSFARAEKQIIRTFRDITAGLATMHSNGIIHLNLNLGNVFIVDGDINRICIAGMLACKYGFDEGQLRSGEMSHHINPTIAPPEITRGHPISGKTDVWMVGCALYEALMIYQRQQLRQRNITLEDPATTVIRLKAVSDILHEIPLATCAPLRSLLRMLLQPNPSQRPQMSQIVDILSFALQK